MGSRFVFSHVSEFDSALVPSVRVRHRVYLTLSWLRTPKLELKPVLPATAKSDY